MCWRLLPKEMRSPPCAIIVLRQKMPRGRSSMTAPEQLPPGVAPDEIVGIIGLLSDTHMPLRRRWLPPELPAIFADVDLLLHAGDVGPLSVLDELGRIAPVVAVHGNDESEEAQRQLPYQQVVSVGGVRILLWHSHFPDWDEEMAFR